RLYRTGDRCRMLPDGSIEYLGRRDGQIKLRGYRIELGEIETLLAEQPGIGQAAVDVHTAGQAEQFLVGYIVPAPDQQPDTETITAALRETLPEYMVPQVWQTLASLPMTGSGKLDRNVLRQLPLDNSAASADQPYTSWRTAEERQLTEIWSTLLNRSRISIYDNFFALGGHSLMAMRMVAAVRARLEVELPLKIIFELNTIESLGRYIAVLVAENTVHSDEYDFITL
ncbi:MAG: phosphopantetheine-binding protein, partial [Chitinophagaceae bacterium]